MPKLGGYNGYYHTRLAAACSRGGLPTTSLSLRVKSALRATVCKIEMANQPKNSKLILSAATMQCLVVTVNDNERQICLVFENVQ